MCLVKNVTDLVQVLSKVVLLALWLLPMDTHFIIYLWCNNHCWCNNQPVCGFLPGDVDAHENVQAQQTRQQGCSQVRWGTECEVGPCSLPCLPLCMALSDQQCDVLSWVRLPHGSLELFSQRRSCSEDLEPTGASREPFR